MSFLIYLIVLITATATVAVNIDNIKVFRERAGSIYDPYNVTDEDYFPCVLYDDNAFGLGPLAAKYRMWHQGPAGTIAMTTSMDGINWIPPTLTNLTAGAAYHISVLYSASNFTSTSNSRYKAWYWTGSPTTDISACKYAESNDGVNWTNVQTITQYGNLLVDGLSPSFFYHFYGPSYVLYNSNATFIVSQPVTWPYMMYYDIATEGQGPGTSVESIGAAYSVDGLNWTRFGTVPVAIPAGAGLTTTTFSYGWDDSHNFRPAVVKDRRGHYHMFYSGSNQNCDDCLAYAHGVGHAFSIDGVTWAKDDTNPIFYYTNGVPWRGCRVYAPSVIYGKFGTNKHTYKMWFSGGIGSVAGLTQGIGYAYL